MEIRQRYKDGNNKDIISSMLQVRAEAIEQAKQLNLDLDPYNEKELHGKFGII
jgi:hypothetical protein